MPDDAIEYVGYPPDPEKVRVTLLDGPLSGVTVSVPPAFPPRIAIHGRRNGNHTIWITHIYHRTCMGYSHVSTSVDDVSSCLGSTQFLSPKRNRG
jgi:hypothetical protein